MIDRTFLHVLYFISNGMIFRAQFGMIEHFKDQKLHLPFGLVQFC